MEDKRLIETPDFPVKEVSEQSVREKQVVAGLFTGKWSFSGLESS